MEKYIDYTKPNFGIEQIKNFNCYSDFHCQSIFWTNGKIDIYASPQWDELIGKCAIQLNSGEELTDGHDFYLGVPYDLDGQNKRYIKILTDIIEALEKPFNNYNELIEIVLNNHKMKGKIIDIDGLEYDNNEVELFEGEIVEVLEIDEYEQVLVASDSGENHLIFLDRIQLLNS